MTDVRASDMKLNRARVEIPRRDRHGNQIGSRFLFGAQVNEFGFLTDGGRVMAITPYMTVQFA